MHLVAAGKTDYIKSRGESYFYLGSFDNPVEIMQYKDIPDYITEEFWSMFAIWNNTRLTNTLPIENTWARNPQYLIDIITAFNTAYDSIRGGR